MENYLPRYRFFSHQHWVYPMLHRVTEFFPGNLHTLECNICGKEILFHSISMSCPFCDYDVCISCFENQQSTDDAKQQKEKFEPIIPIPFKEQNIEKYYPGIDICIVGEEVTDAIPVRSKFPFKHVENYSSASS